MPGVFIGYRRHDVAGHAGRLFDSLAARFGEELVFMDVESLNPSEHFDVAIERTISQCSVVLIVIGPRWIAERSRLDEADDVVRAEIATALRLERPIIPVLVDDARMPDPDDLPGELRGLTRSHAFEISHATFRRDVERLIAHLEKQFIRVPAAFARRRLADALTEGGLLYRGFGALIRKTSPTSALLILGLVVLAFIAAASRRAFNTGWTQGHEQGVTQTTVEYEAQAARQRAASLVLKGLVTDGRQGLDDAEITATNPRTGLRASTRTGQFGRYAVDLKPINISEEDIIQVEVTKPDYRPSRDVFVFREGWEYRSVLSPKQP